MNKVFNKIEYYLFRPITRTGRYRHLPFDYDPRIAEVIEKDEVPARRQLRMNAMQNVQEKLHLSSTDFSAQVCQLRSIFSSLKWHYNQYNMAADDFAAAMTVISHPELIRQGILNYREYVKENEIKVAENKPLTKGDSIFQRIIEPNNIKGEHIHITRAEWGYLKEKFNFSAIPFAAIFDKDGNRRKDKDVQQLLEEIK